MSLCNYCVLRSIRRRARKDEKVTILRDSKWHGGLGVNVYVHPKQINIRKLPGGEDGERAQYRVAWLMELPNRCEC